METGLARVVWLIYESQCLEFEATRVALPHEGRCAQNKKLIKGSRAEYAPERQRIIFLPLIRFIVRAFHMECVMYTHAMQHYVYIL